MSVLISLASVTAITKLYLADETPLRAQGVSVLSGSNKNIPPTDNIGIVTAVILRGRPLSLYVA